MMRAIFLYVFVFAFISGCASSSKKNNTVNQGVQTEAPILGPISSDEPYGPPTPAEEAKKPDSEKQAYAVYFTPAFARSLAYIGVLKALEEKEVLIEVVAGTELSALIAAIWAKNGSNKLEWEMFKFSKEVLFEKKFLTGYEKTSNAASYEKFLKNIFGDGSLEHFKRRTYIAVSETTPGRTKFRSSGRSAAVLRDAIGIPGLVSPAIGADNKKYIAALDEPLFIEGLKEKTENKILCVDALGEDFSKESSDVREETIKNLYFNVASKVQKSLKSCDETIVVDTKNFGFLQFEAKADLIFAGKEAAMKWIESKAE